MVMWVSVAAWINPKINTLSDSRAPFKYNRFRRGKSGHQRHWRGDACRSIINVSISSSGNMSKSRSDWRRDNEDKLTWQRNPRSAKSSNVVNISIRLRWAAWISLSIRWIFQRDGNAVIVPLLSLSLSLFSLDPSQRTNIIVCSSCWLLNRDDGEEAKRRHRVNNKIRWSVQETFVSTALNWPSFLVMKFFAFNLISPDFHLDMKKGQNVQKTWTVSSFLCISRCRTQLVETDDQKVIFRQKWIDRTDDLIRYSVEKSKTDLGNLFEERSN